MSRTLHRRRPTPMCLSEMKIALRVPVRRCIWKRLFYHQTSLQQAPRHWQLWLSRHGATAWLHPFRRVAWSLDKVLRLVSWAYVDPASAGCTILRKSREASQAAGR